MRDKFQCGYGKGQSAACELLRSSFPSKAEQGQRWKSVSASTVAFLPVM